MTECKRVHCVVTAFRRISSSAEQSTYQIGTYQPGWSWSLHVGAITGKPSERHTGFIISGEMMVRGSYGNE